MPTRITVNGGKFRLLDESDGVLPCPAPGIVEAVVIVTRAPLSHRSLAVFIETTVSYDIMQKLSMILASFSRVFTPLINDLFDSICLRFDSDASGPFQTTPLFVKEPRLLDEVNQRKAVSIKSRGGLESIIQNQESVDPVEYVMEMVHDYVIQKKYKDLEEGEHGRRLLNRVAADPTLEVGDQKVGVVEAVAPDPKNHHDMIADYDECLGAIIAERLSAGMPGQCPVRHQVQIIIWRRSSRT